MNRQLRLFDDSDGDEERCSLFKGFDFMLHRKADRSKALQFSVLSSLVRAPRTRIQVDNVIRDYRGTLPDGGTWVGPSMNHLQLLGIIARADEKAANSKRLARKGGTQRLWRLASKRKAETHLQRLKESLRFIEPDGPPDQAGEPS